MDRRLAGATMLLAAFVLVIVGPGFTGRLMVGSAVAAPMPPAPAVGSCLTAGPDSWNNVTASVTPVPWVAFGGCDGFILAEAALVLPLPSGTPVSKYRTLARQSQQDCSAAAQDYLGMVALTASPVGADADALSLSWVPAVSSTVTWVMPDKAQRSAGRAWLACLVRPVHLSSYQGSARGAVLHGRLPAAYGVCWMDPSLDSVAAVTPCELAHGSQSLATGRLADRTDVTIDQVRQTCTQVAARLLGRSDPTADGQLIIRTDPEEFRRWDTASTSFVCFASAGGGDQLTGSVMGVGEDELPLR